MDENEPVTPGGIRLDPASLSWRFSRASGAGGQHVNTTSSRAELRCDLDAAGLDDELRARLVERVGSSVVRVIASSRRSQLRNRELALERLAERLDEAAVVETPRRATKPTRAQREARLDAKKRRSDVKSRRRYRVGDD